MSREADGNSTDGVAIIGVSARITDARGLLSPLVATTGAGDEPGSLADAATWFDVDLFGFDAKTAAALDPEQKRIIERAWLAIEDAGYTPRTLPGVVSIFTATEASGRARGSGATGAVGDASAMAQALRTKGAALSIEAGAASSLAAFAEACHSVLSYQCDIAIVASVGVGRAGALASRGAESAVAFVLRRAGEAAAARDDVRAIVAGASIDHAGAARSGAGSALPDGWLEGTETALAIAGLDDNSIDFMFVEGEHGAPTERGLGALAERLAREPSTALCSCSRSIGDLGAASGMAALSVVISSLSRGALPASLAISASVDAAAREWRSGGAPRRALISSFDAHGAHATVILEEPPELERTAASSSELLLLSARSAQGLEAATEALADRLEKGPRANLADVAYTLKVGRIHSPFRRALAAASAAAARAALRPLDPRRVFTGHAGAGEKPLVFLFPGLGDQYVDMGFGLYATEPGFRKEVDRAADILAPLLGADVRDVLYPGEKWRRPEAAHAAQLSAAPAPARALDFKSMVSPRPAPQTEEARRLNDTRFTQPALFVIEYALARLLMDRGLRPSLMLGYSLGEYVAACIAGVLSLDDALRLVAERARLIAELPSGAMLAVSLSAAEAREKLASSLSISAENGPSLCVVAGPEPAIAELEARLAASSVICRRVQSTHAFHSSMMQPAAPRLVELCRSIELRPPTIPYISNVTGAPIQASQATDPSYWATHLCQPVQFASGAEFILSDPSRLFLEVGPAPGLAALLLQRAEGLGAPPRVAVSFMRNGRDAKDDVVVFQEGLAKIWVSGAKISWDSEYRERSAGRSSLPGPPFERRQVAAAGLAPSGPPALSHPYPRRASDVCDWLFVPSWARALPVDDRPLAPLCAVLIGPQSSLHDALARKLNELGHDVIVARDAQPQGASSAEFTVDSTRDGGYDALLNEVASRRGSHVVFVPLLATLDARRPAADSRALAETSGLYRVLSLLRAVGGRTWDVRARVVAVVSGVEHVLGDESLAPERSMALAAILCGPQEYPSLDCRSVDIVVPPDGGPAEDALVNLLAREIATPLGEPRAALRGAHRWTPTYARLGKRNAPNGPLPLRDGGVYLITGGLGNVGLTLARTIARAARGAKLVLTGRSPTPPRSDWESIPSNSEVPEPIRARTRKLLDIEALGAEVFAAKADAARANEMDALLREIDSRYGRLDGVIHAAGIVGERALAPIRSLRREEVERQIEPKAIGALVLARALADRPVDFCMLVSSISTALGGVELAPYAAANLYLDAIAAAQNREAGRPRWLSVDWDLFSGDYLALTAAGRSLSAFAMSEEQAGEAFVRTLQTPRALDRVIVCTTDLAERIEQARPSSMSRVEAKPEQLDPLPEARSASLQAYVAPRNDIERALAAAFQGVLKVERVGIHDSFFDLGGHSLLATRLIAQLSDTYPVDISLRSLFEAPSVAELGELIVRSLAEHADEGDLADLISSMEGPAR